MTDQKEKLEVEDPAVEVLMRLGWQEIDSFVTEKMRSSLKEFVLLPQLHAAIKRLNPWISQENEQRVVREIMNVQATSVIEANEKLHTIMVRGATVLQDRGDGLGMKSHNVFVIDFECPEKNQYVVVRQFHVQHYKDNYPDLTLFINGIPVIVIECKSPGLKDAKAEGLVQLFRYQEMGDSDKNLGCPKLFHTVQLLGLIYRDKAWCATNFTEERHWSEWKEPYPRTLDDLAALLGHPPTPQDILLFGVCSKENLLDIIRYFMVFERESGRIVKKVAKYQQYRAVNKTIEQVTRPDRSGGFIWHWQGSGKSLTMLWISVKLRACRQLNNPTIVVVTDRTDLDTQIFGTFNDSGFPNPTKAGSARELKELLSHPVGQTIMTTVQKFQDATDIYPILTEDRNVFVLVDEAHRTQYRKFAANMRNAIKNGCFIGFTGTPLFKKERDTFDKFGPYIDKYDHNQSVRDGVTVPIFYEDRMLELNVGGKNTLDELFKRVFKDYTPEQREKIKEKYVTQEAISMASERISNICLDIIKHYEEKIEPNSFKAQIVTVSRAAAVKYYDTLMELGAPSCDVLITAGHNESEFARFQKSKTQEEEVIRRFKEENDPKILIVCDKLLTGFDAPVEQVMYLDSPLKEHSLLQAMGRVNRRLDKKEYGLVVDYWGVSLDLQEALHMYGSDVSEGMIHMDYKNEVLPRLQAAHKAAMDFFTDVKKIQKEGEEYDDACVRFLEPPDRRDVMDQRVKLYSRYMDMLLPDPAALPYLKDLKWLAYIRQRAMTRYRDEWKPEDSCSQKVRKLIDEHVSVDGIRQLIGPIDIFSEKFDEELGKLSSDEAKASEIEHAIKHEIHTKLYEDPIFYETLRDRLKRIIDEYKAGRINAAQQLLFLKQVLDDLRSPGKYAESLGVTPEVAPFYSLLTGGSNGKESLKKAAQDILSVLKRHVVVDWQQKEDTKREMRRDIKRILRAVDYPADAVQDMTAKVMDLAARRL